MRNFALTLISTIIMSAGPVWASLPSHDKKILAQTSSDVVKNYHNLHSSLKSDGAKAYLQWKYISNPQNDPQVEEIVSFLKYYSNWPQMTKIRHSLEHSLLQSGDDNKALRYFNANPPQTFEAQFYYLSILKTSGQKAKAQTLLADIWHNDLLNDKKQAKLLDHFSMLLAQNDHKIRAEFLLNKAYINQASALKPFLPSADKITLDIRKKLIRRSKSAFKSYVSAPQNIKKDRAVMRDLVQYYRKTDQDFKAISQIIAFGKSQNLKEAELWHNHRNVMARVAFKAKRPDAAYNVLKGHGFEKGGKYVSNEWYLGWLALRHLNQPHTALEHFQNARSKSSMPISVARGEYWIGRSHEAIGDNVAAKISYQNASEYFYTYYGQLAMVNLGMKTKELPDAPKRNIVLKKVFDTEPMVQAAYAASAMGNAYDAKRFMLHMANMKNNSPDILPLLADMSKDLNLPDVGVKVAKIATTKNMFLADVGYPVTRHFAKKQSSETPLFMSLTRQESEYNQHAKSHVGARGLMQLMPATAKRVSRKLGQRYSVSRLTSDPDYNVSLGVSYLEGLLDKFDGSYVKSLAGYNAGPSRIPRWVNTYGPPQGDLYAMVDWVETIPYSETRNYVQRILETLQIYRARKYGKDHMTVNIENDLRRGI